MESFADGCITVGEGAMPLPAAFVDLICAPVRIRSSLCLNGSALTFVWAGGALPLPYREIPPDNKGPLL